MCGIVGCVGCDEPQDIVIEALKKLEYRGYDSAGIAIVSDGEIEVRKHVGAISNLEKFIGNERLGGHTGIGHTRWATHGAPSDMNAHPHLGASGKLALVHNGLIENYVELKKELKSEGYLFVSDTDTEVAAVLIGKYYEETGDLKKAFDKAIPEMEGMYAFAAVVADDPDTIVVHKNRAPLLIGKGNGCNFIASDFSALIKYTKRMYWLEDGDTAVVTANGVDIYDCCGNIATREEVNISWGVDAVEKGEYEHFMLKEIYEQPQAIIDTLSKNITDDGKISLNGVSFTSDELENFNKIYIVACGTSYHAGLVGKYIIEKLAKIPVEIDVSSEFRYRDPLLDERTLFIAISQSGETADTLEAIREAKKKGARVLSIVNVVGSSMARESDDVLYTYAGPEIAVASTKAYTTQLVCLYLIALYFAQLRNLIAGEEYDEYISELAFIPREIEQTLRAAEDIETLAKLYYDREQVFFIGRGLDASVAYEGSLKLKEVSYINSCAIAAGELKHGTIALMEPRTIVFALVTQDKLFDKMASNIQEVKSRNAHVISVVKQGWTKIEEYSDEVIYIPACKDELMPLLSIVPLQLFAYYVAREKDCNVDKPRNLAKSVTVE